MEQLFQKLKPQQRLVNILFDEVNLTETLRYSGGRVVGYAQNGSCDSEVLATHALVIEVVCHFGAPKYILRIYPVAKLDSDQLKEVLLGALVAVTNAGGTMISCVGDNCKTNVVVYGKLGGPGKAFINAINSHIFLVFDYVHSFIKEGKTCVARWKDMEALYEEDRRNHIRLTKITSV